MSEWTRRLAEAERHRTDCMVAVVAAPNAVSQAHAESDVAMWDAFIHWCHAAIALERAERRAA